MGPHKSAGYTLGFDLRHVAGYALTAGAAVLVVGVFRESRGVGAVGRRRPMTVQAELVNRLSELSIVLRAVYVMAGRAGDTVFVHDTLHKIVALHPVLVRGAVREVREARLSQCAVFQLPVVLEMKTNVIADRPIIGLALDLLGERLTL